jgi:DNA processing protein
MTDAEAQDRLRLARTETVGPITYRRLLARFGSAAAALAALPGLARAGGRDALPVPSRDEAGREIDRTARLGGAMLFLDAPGYPPLLATLEDAPPVIAVLGDPAVLSARSVAIVGGRNASANGQRFAELLASELARAGLVVVSGMARGIDAAAHEGALRAGCTVAAVAGGLDLPYPPEHAELQRRIAAAGAVVTEAPLGTAPQSRHFPRRNRLIAGLALGCVVIEAAPRSGSLITARLALDANRELFAAPGSPLDPRCRGSNDLLRQGAHLVEDASDVLQHLPPEAAPRPAALGFSEPPPEATAPPPTVAPAADLHDAVIELLEPSPTPVDFLIRRCQLPAAVVMAALVDLELAGRVEMLPGNRVARVMDPGF